MCTRNVSNFADEIHSCSTGTRNHGRGDAHVGKDPGEAKRPANLQDLARLASPSREAGLSFYGKCTSMTLFLLFPMAPCSGKQPHHWGLWQEP